MKKRNIVVSFPLDRRTDYSRNDLLDGANHEIEIDLIETFDIENQQFYLVSGFDITRNCDIVILLKPDGNILIKVPLLDYDELYRYQVNSRVLNEREVQSLLDRNGNYISAMSLTTISNIVAQKKPSPHSNIVAQKKPSPHSNIEQEALFEVRVFPDGTMLIRNSISNQYLSHTYGIRSQEWVSVTKEDIVHIERVSHNPKLKPDYKYVFVTEMTTPPIPPTNNGEPVKDNVVEVIAIPIFTENDLIVNFYTYDNREGKFLQFENEPIGNFSFFKNINYIGEKKFKNKSIESIVSELLSQDGFTINSSYKVKINALLLNYCMQVVVNKDNNYAKTHTRTNVLADNYYEYFPVKGYIHRQNSVDSKFNGFSKYIYDNGDNPKYFNDEVYNYKSKSGKKR